MKDERGEQMGQDLAAFVMSVLGLVLGCIGLGFGLANLIFARALLRWHEDGDAENRR